MSTAEILAELHRLTPEEREAIRARLDAIDEAAPLSPEEKRLAEERIAAYRRDPGSAKTWVLHGKNPKVLSKAGLTLNDLPNTSP